MDETKAHEPAADNPYRYHRDDALETFARGRIDEAIAKSTSSPRQFGYYSTLAAKQIAQYVLEHFGRRKPDD
jgi:hypothetical protein